jgi:diaminohydroxyphosphoribosylaminopyrimidine deaminase/5-amino-6-(5-phosphoribosylamino)uracil reductase
MAVTDVDRAFLERAATLARRGWGRVHPNPMVGCVLTREGEVVAEAHHREFGGPHAEVLALEAAADARGTTAYVSLEPCSHQGKTPPCTRALAEAGVRRVVFGAADPTVQAGGGADALRAEGMEVLGPVFDMQRAQWENPSFFHTSTHRTPWVALKLAVSMDGRIASAPGVRTRLTGAEADREVHRLRAGFDAILVGSGTARLDDPRLTVREDVPMRRPPTRIVLDSDASLSTGAAVFRDIETAPLRVMVREDAHAAAVADLERAGATVDPVRASSVGPGLDLEAVLAGCWDAGIRSILCEGGATLGTSLIAADLVGRIYLFVTPHILGARGVPAFRAPIDPAGGGWIPSKETAMFGRDYLLVYDRPAQG